MVHKPPIQILTTAGVEMTEPLKNHIKNKMGNVFDRMGKDVLSAHVTLKLNRHKSGGM
jgi:ribosome-associated translation inhibitor RaiA